MNRDLERLQYILQQLSQTLEELPADDFIKTRNDRLAIYQQLKDKYPELVKRLEDEPNGSKAFERGVIVDLISAIATDLNKPVWTAIPTNRDELIKEYIDSLEASPTQSSVAQSYQRVMQARKPGQTSFHQASNAFDEIYDSTQKIINPENVQFPADHSDRARDNKVVADQLSTRIAEIVAENSFGDPEERADTIEEEINEAYRQMYNVSGVTKRHQEVIRREAERLAALPVETPEIPSSGNALTDEIAKKIATVTIGQQVTPEQIAETAQAITPQVQAAINNPATDKTPDQQVAEVIRQGVEQTIAPLVDSPAIDKYLRTSTNSFVDIQSVENFREELPQAVQQTAYQSVNEAVQQQRGISPEAVQAYQDPQVQQALQRAIDTTANTLKVAANPRDNATAIQEAAQSIMAQEVYTSLKDDPRYQQWNRDKAGYEQVAPSLQELVTIAAGGMASGFMDKQAEHAVALAQRDVAAAPPVEAVRSTARQIVDSVKASLPSDINLSRDEEQQLYSKVVNTIDDNTYQLRPSPVETLKEKIATDIEEVVINGPQRETLDLSGTLQQIEPQIEPALGRYNFELTKAAAEKSLDYLEAQAKAAFPAAETVSIKAEDFPAPPAPTQEVIVTGRGERAAEVFTRPASLIVKEVTPTLQLDAQEQADLQERLELTLTGMASAGKTRQEMQQRVAEIIAENPKGVDSDTLDAALKHADFMAEGQAKVGRRQFNKVMAGPEDARVYDTNAGQEPATSELAGKYAQSMLNNIDGESASTKSIVDDVARTLKLDNQERRTLQAQLGAEFSGMVADGRTQQEIKERAAEIVSAIHEEKYKELKEKTKQTKEEKETLEKAEKALKTALEQVNNQEPPERSRQIAGQLIDSMQKQAASGAWKDEQAQRELAAYAAQREELIRAFEVAKMSGDVAEMDTLHKLIIDNDRHFIASNQNTMLASYYDSGSVEKYQNERLQKIAAAKEAYKERQAEIQQQMDENRITAQEGLDALKRLHKDSSGEITQNLIELQMQLDSQAIKKSDEEKILALQRAYIGSREDQRRPATSGELNVLKRGLEETNWYDRGNFLASTTDNATRSVEKHVGDILEKLAEQDPSIRSRLAGTAFSAIKRDTASAVMQDLAATTSKSEVQFSILSTLKTTLEDKVTELTGKKVKLDPGSTAGDLLANSASKLAGDKKVQAAAAMQSIMPIVPHMTDEVEEGDLYGHREAMREMMAQDYEKGVRDIQKNLDREIKRGLRKYRKAASTPPPDSSSGVIITERGEKASQSFDRAAALIVKEINPTLNLDISTQYELREQIELSLVGMASAGKSRAEMRAKVQELVTKYAGNVSDDVLTAALKHADFMAEGQTRAGRRLFKKAMAGPENPQSYGNDLRDQAIQGSFDQTANRLASKAAKTFSMDAYDEGELRRQISDMLVTMARQGKTQAEMQSSISNLIQQTISTTEGGKFLAERERESKIVTGNQAIYLSRKQKRDQFYREDASMSIASLLEAVRSANPNITDDQLNAIAENTITNTMGGLKIVPIQAKKDNGDLMFDKDGQPVYVTNGKDADGNDLIEYKLEEGSSVFGVNGIMGLSKTQLRMMAKMSPAEQLEYLSKFDELRRQQIFSSLSISLKHELMQFGVWTPQMEKKLNSLRLKDFYDRDQQESYINSAIADAQNKVGRPLTNSEIAQIRAEMSAKLNKKMSVQDAIAFHMERGYSLDHFVKQFREDTLRKMRNNREDEASFYDLSRARNSFSNNINTIEALLDPRFAQKYARRKVRAYKRDAQKFILGAVGIDKDSSWTAWFGSMVNGTFQQKMIGHEKNLAALSKKYKMDVAQIAKTGIKPKNISLFKSLELDRAIRSQRGLDAIKKAREANPRLAFLFDKRAQRMQSNKYEFSAELFETLLHGSAGIKALPGVVSSRLMNATINKILTEGKGFRNFFVYDRKSRQILFTPYEELKMKRDEAVKQLKEAAWNSRPMMYAREQGDKVKEYAKDQFKKYVWDSKPVKAVRNRVKMAVAKVAGNAVVKGIQSLATKIAARLTLEGILAVLPTGVTQVAALILAIDTALSSIPIVNIIYGAIKFVVLTPLRWLWKLIKIIAAIEALLALYAIYRLAMFAVQLLHAVASVAAIGGAAGTITGFLLGGVPGAFLGGIIGWGAGAIAGTVFQAGKFLFGKLTGALQGGVAIGTGGALGALMPGWLSGFLSGGVSALSFGLFSVPAALLNVAVASTSAIAGWLTSMGAAQALAVVSTGAAIGLTALFSPAYITAVMESLRKPLDKAVGELATFSYPLQVTKIADKTKVNQNGEQIKYTITVSGPACSPTLTVTDKLPDTLTFDPSVPPSFGTPLDPLVDSITPPTGPDANNTLTWTIKLKPTAGESCNAAQIDTGANISILDPNKNLVSLADMQALLAAYPGGSFKPMKDTAQYFIDGQQKYGINPLFVAGIAAFESTMGIGGIGRPPNQAGTSGCYNATNLKSPNTNIPQKYGGTRDCTNPDFWRFPSYEANLAATYEWIQTYHVNKGETDVDSIMARYQGTDDLRNTEVAIIKCTMKTKRVCSDGSGGGGGTTAPTFTATLTFAGIANAPKSGNGPNGDGCIVNTVTAQLGSSGDVLTSTGGATTAVGPAKCNELQSLPQGTIAEAKAFMCSHPTIKICPTVGTKYPPNSDWTREQLEALWTVAQKVYQAEPYRSYAVGNYGIEVQRSRCYIYFSAVNCPPTGADGKSDNTQGFNQGVDASFATMQFSAGVTPKVVLIMNGIGSINGNNDILQYLYAHEIAHSAQKGTASGGIGDRTRNPANQPVLALNEVVSLYGAPTTYCISTGGRLRCGSGLPFENNADAISYYMTNGEVGGNYRAWTGNTNNLKTDHPNTYNALMNGFFATGASGGPQEYGP